MKWYYKSTWFLIALAVIVTSCSEDEEDSVNRNPVKTDNRIPIENVIHKHVWEMYDWRTLESKVFLNGVEQSHTETYATTAIGSYTFVENSVLCNIDGEFFVFGTVDANSTALFPDTTYNTPSLLPALPYTTQYKILDDSTMVVEAFFNGELTAYNVENDLIQLRGVFNEMTFSGPDVTTTTYVLEIDLAPQGTKLAELGK